MDDLLEGSLKGVLTLASMVARCLVWLVLQVWEYCLEIILWYMGWPICHLASFGHLPKQFLNQHQQATRTSLFTVCWVGAISPF